MDRTTFFDRLPQGRVLAGAEVGEAVSPCDAQAGETQPLSLGQYRLLEELGRGGMGRVYKALHTIMDRVVAIKVISTELVSDPIAVEWFRREVRASTQLNHPNIVMAYDANEAEGMHFLVMEYVHGITLESLVKKHGALPVPHACALIRQAALGMQHAHDKGMVHRDIKPSNLLIPLPEGDQPPEVLVKILDFGLARLHGKTKGDTIALRGETGVLGTPDYIAPEQSRDIHAADIRSDLYSLGCVFYFALAGHVPFPGDNAMEKLIKHLMEQPEPLEIIRPDVPPAVTSLVRRLLAKDPADRFQTPAELVSELEMSAAPASDWPLRNGVPRSTTSVRPKSDPHPQSTCVLDKIEVFLPLPQEVEQSGPSLLEPEWKYAPGEQRRPDTNDTLSLSRAEQAEQAKAERPAHERKQPPSDWGVDCGSALPAAAPSRNGALQRELPPIDRALLSLWPRWTELVEIIVTGHGASRVNENSYRAVHVVLLQACRAAIDSCPIPERRAFYEECLSIVQPWFKLQAFVHTDASILESLLQRCRRIEVELNDGKAPWAIRQIIGLVLIVFSLVGGTLWYWYFGGDEVPALLHEFNGTFSTSLLRAVWSFLLAHPPLMIGAIFPLVFFFSLALLPRPRSR